MAETKTLFTDTPLDVVIMAAGKGTRMKSKLPKVLHRLAGRALVQHVIDTAAVLSARQVTVITGDVSAALNRLAISHAGSGKSRLGEIVLKNGPLAMTGRLRPIFEIGISSGLIECDSIDAALKTFFGLVVGDWQIRKLLGETTRPSRSGIEHTATRAVDQFLLLYGTGNTHSKSHT